jgi:hypothetical protein
VLDKAYAETVIVENGEVEVMKTWIRRVQIAYITSQDIRGEREKAPIKEK